MTTLTTTLSTDWFQLVQLYPLRPIESQQDHQKAMKLLRRLALLDRMTKEQSDYFRVLTTLVSQYETNKFLVDTETFSTIEILQSFMDDHQMTPSDLGRLLGDRTLGHKILHGQRKLSLQNIQTLAKHFAVSPALFIESAQ